MDWLDTEARSALMRRVKQANTKPELIVRKELHHRGLRYVIGDRRLPGSPDLSFPRHRAVVFVHGCFWHGHSCRRGRLPTSNVAYWTPKIAANRERDGRKVSALKAQGWRVFTVWECEIGNTADVKGRMDSLAASIRGTA